MYRPISFQRRILIISVYMIGLSACTPFFYQPLGEERHAELGPETALKQTLLDLPEPKEPVVVAVYKFRDQTGQYKPSSVGSSWSTAVTQGATNILIRTLEESGWFVPIERENISNLLNERKIIRSSREQYEGQSGGLLPPLLFAGVILEGGIVSYETNVFTGGAGVRYFGTDVSAQYREDRVSVYLRAISTGNGKVLKTIYTTKSILSQEVSAGVFRYVKYKRLLEAEIGYTYNEPTEMAVTEAIEKAVQGLIIEGVIDNLWALNDEAEKDGPQIQDYLEEKSSRLEVDYIGRKFDDSRIRGPVSLSLMASAQAYSGDYATSPVWPGLSASIGLRLSKNLFLETNGGVHSIEVKDVMRSNELYGDMSLLFLTNPTGKFCPFASLGGGSYFGIDENVGLSEKSYMPYITLGAGAEYLFNNWFALSGRGFFNQMLYDDYDGANTGTYNDILWGFQGGIKVYW